MSPTPPTILVAIPSCRPESAADLARELRARGVPVLVLLDVGGDPVPGVIPLATRSRLAELYARATGLRYEAVERCIAPRADTAVTTGAVRNAALLIARGLGNPTLAMCDDDVVWPPRDTSSPRGGWVRQSVRRIDLGGLPEAPLWQVATRMRAWNATLCAAGVAGAPVSRSSHWLVWERQDVSLADEAYYWRGLPSVSRPMGPDDPTHLPHNSRSDSGGADAVAA